MWSAKVEQEFEVEADNEEDARAKVENLMEPHHVNELTQCVIDYIDEDEDEDEDDSDD